MYQGGSPLGGEVGPHQTVRRRDPVVDVDQERPDPVVQLLADPEALAGEVPAGSSAAA